MFQRLFSLFHINNNCGLTLTEILVSIILIGILLTSFFTSFVQSGKFAQNNEDQFQVSNTIRTISNKVEQLTIDDLLEKKILSENQLKDDFSIIIDDPSVIQSLINVNTSGFEITLEFRPGPENSNESNITLIEVVINVTVAKQSGPDASSKTFTYIGWDDTEPET